MDILPTDLMFSFTGLNFDDFNDEAFNPEFDALGFGSLNSIKNMGSTFVFMMINVGVLVIMAAVYIIRRRVKR